MIKLGIDFDGVICKRSGIPTQGKWEECNPVEGAKDSIELFINQGIEVYICTNREHYEWPDMRVWLDKCGFSNLKLRITNKKEKDTTVYIDDRALRFTNWNDMRKYFS